MIANQTDYEKAMLALAESTDEDIVNDLIDDIREYETNHLGMTFPEDEVLFGGEYNG